MATVTIPLEHGVQIGEKTHRTLVLKELQPGDLIDAGLESERAVETADGYVFAVSPTLMGINTLLRQIESIGDYDGPVTMEMLKRLHREDFELLQYTAEQLDLAVVEAVQKRGRSDASGAEFGSPDSQI